MLGNARTRAAVVTVLFAVAALIHPLDAGAETTITNGCVESVPEPGSSAPVAICYTLYRPASATSDTPVPVIFASHGWGGSRTNEGDAFRSFLGAGFGVLSFDQRGFGESSGKAHIENPDFEGQDVQRLVDLVAGLDWVAQESSGDPVLGAMGGSYGGGFQFVGAFTELRDRGDTRFDALAPEITWWDLNDSLGPSGVARTEWGLLLYLAGGLSSANTKTVTEGLLESAVTGNWPTRIADFFARNGPAWHVSQGRQLDIPVLFGQGITDNLFNVNQALHNFNRALTPEARQRSILVGYNGGHVLPSLLPLSSRATGDPCSAQLSGGGDFGDLRLQFFEEELLGLDRGVTGRGRHHLATTGGRCVTIDDAAANTGFPAGQVINTVGLGVPLSVPIVKGPITIAGAPTLDARVTSLALDGRVFLGLSVGTNPLDALLVDNNVLPLRQQGLTLNQPRTGVELPAVAVDVPAGKTLYLTVSPLSDMSFGHGSRVPGAMSLTNVVVHLPVVS